MHTFKKFLAAHKIAAGIAAVALAAGGYWAYGKFSTPASTTKYVAGNAEKGTLVISVSGTGQVSSVTQAELKPKVSGTVVKLHAKAGDRVKAGTALMKLDTSDAEKSVRDARASLDSAELSLAKLTQPATALESLQAQNALANAEDAKAKAVSDLAKAYDDGFNNVSNAFTDLPAIMTGLNSMLLSGNITPVQWDLDYYADAVKFYDSRATQYRNDAFEAYQAARAAYDKNFADYKAMSRTASTTEVAGIIRETYGTAKLVADALQNASNLIQFYKDQMTQNSRKPDTRADTALSSLTSYTSKTNADLLSLLSAKNSIDNGATAIANADRSIAEKTATLEKLKAGADPLDVEAQQISVRQRRNALLDAEQNLANYTIRAPFDGTVAKIAVNLGDQAGGASAATFIAEGQTAVVTLNEVDAAKAKTGQKATLEFDALPDVAMTGTVTAVDVTGTVSQGVVSYGATIAFDAPSEAVRPGMSVSATIVTEAKTDALTVPNAAVKKQGTSAYVQIWKGDTAAPERRDVTVGKSNGTATEILSGLSEGEQVVVRTVTSGATATPQANGGFRIPGMGGGR